MLELTLIEEHLPLRVAAVREIRDALWDFASSLHVDRVDEFSGSFRSGLDLLQNELETWEPGPDRDPHLQRAEEVLQLLERYSEGSEKVDTQDE